MIKSQMIIEILEREKIFSNERDECTDIYVINWISWVLIGKNEVNEKRSLAMS